MDRTISKEMLEKNEKIAAEMTEEEEEMKRNMFMKTITEDIRDDSFHRLLGVLEMSSHFAKTLLERLEKRKDRNLGFDNAGFWKDEACGNEDKYSRTIHGQHVSDRQPAIVDGIVMYPYQIDGYLWLKSLYENGVNGILADEMGLGKTVQCVALIGYLTEMGTVGPFLVCAPLSILPSWISEVALCAPSLVTVLYHGSPMERAKQRSSIKKNNCLVLASYEIAVRDRKFLQRFRWKYLILDEGHRIKNFRCKLVRELKQYPSVNRLLLTGTPLQNDLSELWSMLNFLLPEIFSDLHSFESWFDIIVLQSPGMENEIIRREQETRVVATMHDILTPFLLRRTKDDVNVRIPPKKQVLVCLPLTKNQRLLCQETLTTKAREEFLNHNRKKKPEELAKDFSSTDKRAISGDRKDLCKALKRVKRMSTAIGMANCDDILDSYLGEDVGNSNCLAKIQGKTHLSSQQAQDTKLKGSLRSQSRNKGVTNNEEQRYETRNSTRNIILETELGHSSNDHQKTHRRINPNAILDLLKIVNHPFLVKDPDDWNTNDVVTSSSKMQFLDQLLPFLKNQGHRVLIYSQLNLMLDVLEEFCKLRNFQFVRLDGTMAMKERQDSLELFSADPDVFIFLLSTRAGGLGLNLSCADTVVIYDSDWNPQRDLQAQDRCHRIGQTKPVVVYRLVVENSVDQRVVEKACFKRKLEKMIIKRGRFLTGCHENEMHPEDLSKVLKDEEYSMVVRLKGEPLTDEQLNILTDRSDLSEDMLAA